jgi:hypothetical protein
MSSTNRDSNLINPQAQELTRREFIHALALGITAVTGFTVFGEPVIGGPSWSTDSNPIFNTGLTDLIVKLAAFDAYLCKLANNPGSVDAEALYQRYGEASQAAFRLDQLLISVEFEQTILGPLAGGIERYHVALEIEPDEAIVPAEPEPVKATLSREEWAKVLDDMEAVLVDMRAKHLS